MTSPLLFDRGSMLRALEGLDRVMVERGLPHQRLVIVGGSYLALGEDTNRDVLANGPVIRLRRRGDRD